MEIHFVFSQVVPVMLGMARQRSLGGSESRCTNGRTDHAHRISLAKRNPPLIELHDAFDNSSDDAPETRQIVYPPPIIIQNVWQARVRSRPGLQRQKKLPMLPWRGMLANVDAVEVLPPVTSSR